MSNYAALRARALLLLSDDELRPARIGSLVAAAGGRLVVIDPLSGALARIDRQAGHRHVVADLREHCGAALDLLLARLDAASTTRSNSLAIAARAPVDRSVTRITDSPRR